MLQLNCYIVGPLFAFLFQLVPSTHFCSAFIHNFDFFILSTLFLRRRRKKNPFIMIVWAVMEFTQAGAFKLALLLNRTFVGVASVNHLATRLRFRCELLENDGLESPTCFWQADWGEEGGGWGGGVVSVWLARVLVMPGCDWLEGRAYVATD